MLHWKMRFFTMIEVLSVMIIMAIIVALAIPTLKQIFTTKAVDSAAIVLRSKLSGTSVEALRKNCPVGLFIPIETSVSDGQETGDYYAYASCRRCYLYNDSSEWSFVDRVNLNKSSNFDSATPWENFPKGAVIDIGKMRFVDSNNGFIWTKAEIDAIYNLSAGDGVLPSGKGTTLNTVTIGGVKGKIIAFLPNGRAASVSGTKGVDLTPSKFALRIVNGVLNIEGTDFEGARNIYDFVTMLIDQTGGQIRVISPDDSGYSTSVAE